MTAFLKLSYLDWFPFLFIFILETRDVSVLMLLRAFCLNRLWVVTLWDLERFGSNFWIQHGWSGTTHFEFCRKFLFYFYLKTGDSHSCKHREVLPATNNHTLHHIFPQGLLEPYNTMSQQPLTLANLFWSSLKGRNRLVWARLFLLALCFQVLYLYVRLPGHAYDLKR